MIIKNNEEALRVDCEDVTPEEIAELTAELDKELKISEKFGAPGIGLAAPQIGIAKNFAIVRCQGFNIELVNAKIIKSFDLQVFEEEGCLSFPGRIEKTMRYNEITVENFDKKFIARGLVAIVIQHELDHLHKILLPDVVIK